MHHESMAQVFPPLNTSPGRQRPDLDEQVLRPGGEPPGAVPAGRAGVIDGGKGKRWATGRIMPVRFAPLRGPGAAVPDRVPLAVGHGHAPGGPWITGRGLSEVAGEVRVDGPD